MKVAIVHDFLVELGGAEQVLKSLHNLYPEAPIYTLLHDKKKMGGFLDNADIRTSGLQKLPKFLRRRKWWLLPLMPVMPETFDLREYDLVISSSNSFAKGVITKPKTAHISYCHAPMRFAWDWNSENIQSHGSNFFARVGMLFIMNYLRMWDRSSADRVSCFVANSETTAARIKKYYRKDSVVIYPPVDTKELLNELPAFAGMTEGAERNEMLKRVQHDNGANQHDSKTSYFLIISRLSKYKRIDLAVEAFNKLQLPLVIIGDGKERQSLQKIANSNIKFLGYQPEVIKKSYLRGCFAFIFPGEEDFGISPVEAMSYGKPVLAYRAGGLQETMIEGKTGEFFDAPVPELLAEGVRRMINQAEKYDSNFIAEHSRQFSREVFEERFKYLVEKVMGV